MFTFCTFLWFWAEFKRFVSIVLKVSTRVIDSEAYKEWKKMESDMEDFYKECPALKPATDVQAGILYVARIDCSW